MMGEAVASGDLDYFDSSFDLADFGVHMNCRDISTLRTLIDGSAVESFLHSLFPDQQLPRCEYSQSYMNWLESHYDEDTLEVNVGNIYIVKI
jgi:hypothetical protein